MSEKFKRQDAEAVAIIGLAGRFPGADNVAQYWKNLCDGVESLTISADEQLEGAGVSPEQWSNPRYVRVGGVIENADAFDAPFFGLNAREAEIVDPQQRVFLECAWEALEDAGHDPALFAGEIGLYAGAGMNTYGITSLFMNPEILAQVGPYQVMLGNDKDFLATRVAYKLNLKGPAVAVQTACSTSLVAVQMAFESLLRGECDMALAGGVSIHFPQYSGYMFMPGMILSSDGHCRAFDADAAGTVPGRGAGIVVLRRLSDALADHDQIYAVIRGAAINNDGTAKIGYSAPSVEGQSRVIKKSMEMAGFAPSTVSYIEAHGTGTEVGDPIEITALNQIFGLAGHSPDSCAIGSVKTNIGHLDTAAGVAGLIKAALAIKHRLIPPTLHFKRPNPHIDFHRTPFFVNTVLLPYDKLEPFRVGVSSFGIGGTNAHVSLEEAPPTIVTRPDQGSQSPLPQLLVLSARSEEALQAHASSLLDHFKQHLDEPLSRAAFTLQVGRRSFRYRRAFVASDTSDAVNILEGSSSPRIHAGVVEGESPEAVFLFPGQGSQYVNMGCGLYESVPQFRQTIDACAQMLEPHLQLDLRTVLFPAKGDEDAAAQRLNETAITQPALFVIEYATARLWMDHGIQPTAMLGHSVGEYVAACIAGVFSLKDALRLIATRGRLIQAAEPGAMLAVALDKDALTPLLESGVSIAALNSAGQSVASGSFDAIGRLEAVLTDRAIEHKRLRTSHAFHSALLDPILEPFRDAFNGLRLNAPVLPYLSNLTGTWVTGEQATDPDFWVSHLRNTVRFADCAKRLDTASRRILIEVGPGETLLSFLRQDRHTIASYPKIASMRSARSSEDDHTHWLESVGRVWLAGARPKWEALHLHGQPLRTSLPTYPFERQRYWIDPSTSGQGQSQPSHGVDANARAKQLSKQVDIADWFFIPSWKRLLPLPLKAATPLGNGHVWLLLTEEGGDLAAHLRATLQDYGRVVEVYPGEHFEQIDEDHFRLAPGVRDQWTELMQALLAAGRWPERVVHAWTISGDSGSTLTVPEVDLENSLNRGFFSVMFLTQSIGDHSSVRPVDIKIITNNSRSVQGEVVENLAAAPLAALCRVIPIEYPNIRCGVIDLAMTDRDSLDRAAKEQLAQEVLSESGNTLVALRPFARWQERYEPVRFEKDLPRQLRVVDGGVYIITGGLGGFGFVFAEYLARTAHAHLILTTRFAFPEESAWDALLQDEGTPEQTRDRVRNLRNIIAAGGKVTVVAANVSDTRRMQEVVVQCGQQFGVVRGIIHAAGLPSFNMIQLKSQADALAVLAPKIHGVRWIQDSLSLPDLDFVLLCSSISAAIPSYGLGDYAAANAYLDAFAAAFDRPGGTRVVSVNWDTWSDVGMAVDLARNSSAPAISPFEAQEVFERILGCPFSRVVISTRDLTAMLKIVADELSRAHRQTESSSLTRPPTAHHPRPSLSQPYAPPVDETEVSVIEIWQELLGIDSIGRHDNFFELGGHSLLGTQVIARLRTQFGLDLPLRTVFEAATPAELAIILRTTQWTANSNITEITGVEREEIEI